MVDSAGSDDAQWDTRVASSETPLFAQTSIWTVSIELLGEGRYSGVSSMGNVFPSTATATVHCEV